MAGSARLSVVVFFATSLAACQCGSKQTSPKPTGAAESKPSSGANAAAVIDAGIPPDAARYRESRRKLGQLPPCNERNGARPLAHNLGAPIPSGDRYTCKQIQPDEFLAGWGYNIGWLAVSSDDAAAIAAALDLDVKQVRWNRGVAEAYHGGATFITPPIEGWTFVIGRWIVEADARRLETTVVALSREFGEVQAFVTNRYFEYHGLVLAQTNKLRRSFVFDGEKKGVVRNEGKPLPEEGEIDRTHVSEVIANGETRRTPITVMTPTGSIRSMEPLPNDIWTENVVHRLAAKLSLDPTTISKSSVPNAVGWLGIARNLE